jgi:hypothetical protein
VNQGNHHFLQWRTKSESDKNSSRGTPHGVRTILSREQLAEFTLQLQRLSDDGVERIYETTYRECRYDGKKLPPAAAIQQLVACWRVSRKFRAMSGIYSLKF